MSWFLRNRWMFVPVLLLSLTVAIGVTTVLSAVVGHPLGAEPQYSAKAAAWDAERAQRAANERLRWVVTPAIRSEGARRVLSLRIEDKHGARIDAEEVAVECIPVRAAEARRFVRLSRLEAGAYEGAFESPLGGQWEFRVRVVDDGVRYTDEVRRPLPPAPGAGSGSALAPSARAAPGPVVDACVDGGVDGGLGGYTATPIDAAMEPSRNASAEARRDLEIHHA